ncbi:MAG: IS630 family transposase [Planctomycetota bacterium]|nr:MAG: IS630 family transposase [Planctomycetota bacterium]
MASGFGSHSKNKSGLGFGNGSSDGRPLRRLRKSDCGVRQFEYAHDQSLLRGFLPRASEQSEEAVQEQRRQWHADTGDIDAKRFVLVDEIGIATNMTRFYGRAPANEPVYADVPHRHYESLTVLGGMRLEGSEEFPTMVYEGGTTTDRMVEHVTGPLREVLHPGDIVVADRLGAHKANRVADALAEQEAEIRLLPPYSPDLNPIERMWSKTKAFLRAAKATTVDRLRTALQVSLKTITNTDIHNWIAHCNYLVPD